MSDLTFTTCPTAPFSRNHHRTAISPRRGAPVSYTVKCSVGDGASGKVESKQKKEKKEKEKTKKSKKTKEKPPNPNQVLSEQELTEWKNVRSILQSLTAEMDEETADKIIARAFGWGSQKWWRGDVKYEAPRSETVYTSLDFLRNEIGYDDVTIGTRILKKFPEIIRMPVDRMRGNVAHIQKLYPVLNGPVLRDSLTKVPTALGFDVDCGGDCMSECSRCWVRFE